MTGRAAVFLALCLFLAAAGPTGAAQRRITDDSGRTTVFSRPFERIISLYGAHTENLFELGLGAEIIGVTRNEDHPPAALEKPVFHYRDDPERFIAVRPDLVLIRPMIFNGYGRLVSRLRDAGIEVVSLQPNTVEEMYVYWRRLGALTGREERAEAMVSAFQATAADIAGRTADVARADRPRVYFEAIHTMMKTFAPSAMAVFALESAGGVNVAADAVGRRGTNIAEYGKERILFHAGEIDVYLAQTGPMNQVTKDTIENESGFGAIKAVREGRIHLVDEKIVSRPTMRLIEGMGEIGAILYPARFPEPTE